MNRRAALVTGAGRGIGLATARRFAEVDAKVCLTNVRVLASEEASFVSGQVLYVAGGPRG